MKKIVAILCLICLLVPGIVAATAETEITPYASECFRNVKITVNSSGSATFTATLKYRCDTIKVTSCILQKKVGNDWKFSKALSTPESVSNAYRYSKSMDYSSHMTSGVSYRMVAVFDADGNTMSVTSTVITY